MRLYDSRCSSASNSGTTWSNPTAWEALTSKTSWRCKVATQLAAALAQVQISQRIRLLPGINGSTIIDDTYNASPESMRAALDLLADWPREQGGQRLAFLGTMRELGPRSWREHHRLGRRAAWRCSTLWVTGEERDAIAAGARAGGLGDVRVFADLATAAANCVATLQRHDVLLVKASHAVGLDQVVPLLLADEQRES
jgi:UDP-N-acetylmuramoyl-tripeptide--D-alanyl-D-alanine ligase